MTPNSTKDSMKPQQGSWASQTVLDEPRSDHSSTIYAADEHHPNMCSSVPQENHAPTPWRPEYQQSDSMYHGVNQQQQTEQRDESTTRIAGYGDAASQRYEDDSGCFFWTNYDPPPTYPPVLTIEEDTSTYAPNAISSTAHNQGPPPKTRGKRQLNGSKAKQSGKGRQTGSKNRHRDDRTAYGVQEPPPMARYLNEKRCEQPFPLAAHPDPQGGSDR